MLRSLLLSSLVAVVATAATAPAAEEESPIPWHLSVSKGLAEAKAKNRPVIMVFPEGHTGAFNWFENSYVKNGKRYWPSLRPLECADVVLIKATPPGDFKLPAGASAAMVKKFNDARQKIRDRYKKLVDKYGVFRLPTVLFLSPDGQMVFKSYTRTNQEKVVHSMRFFPHYFHDYQHLAAIIEGKDRSTISGKHGGGSSQSPVPWYTDMKQAIAEAKTSNRPICLVFTDCGALAHHWFGYLQDPLTCDLTYPGMDEIKAANVVLCVLGRPTEMKRDSTATSREGRAVAEGMIKLREEYKKLGNKYGVTALPTVLFLSPDGETVLKTMSRKSESTVLSELKKMPRIFREYKQLQEMLKEAGE